MGRNKSWKNIFENAIRGAIENVKKYFYIGMAIIVLLVMILLGYGTYLNERGENQITELMENRMIPLKGTKAEIRNIYPQIMLEIVNLSSEEMTDVVALINGRVVKEYVQKNSQVRQGDILFELENEDIPLKLRQIDSDILQSEIELSRAKNSFQRYSMLKDMDAISQEKYEETKAVYDAAEARLENYLAQKAQISLQEAHQQVTAPINGEVLMIYRQQGSYVTAGTAVALIGNFQEMTFSTAIEDEIAQLMTIGETFELSFGRHEEFQKPYGAEYAVGNKGREQTFTAKIKEITPNLTEKAAIRKILWTVDNRAGILEPRVYNNVRLRPTIAKKCLTIPLEAMIDNTKSTVFTVLDNGTLKIKKVVTGANDGKFVEIISGLNENEIVITSDTNGLSEGMKADVTIEAGDDDGGR
ncbi:MAG: efflux RND transporter periplasmic adaptor subunit [Selenomonadaceae bacterium]|nr:efflux RND transporter periplasmic adaptor subunit [Selenomonadaceae bacterium]